jgi:alpha-1,2-mannosyltransferase
MTIASNRKARQAPEEAVVQQQTQNISPYWIFSIILVPRLLAAQYSIIGDCDEGIPSQFDIPSTDLAVYNYWEPTHYLVHGSGFQTWEYSPVYAIRSWAYIAIHAFVIKSFDLLRLSKVPSRLFLP